MGQCLKVIFLLKADITFKRKIGCLLIFIVDAPIKFASFYVERIDLASKLRKVLPKWRWCRPFSGKKSPHKFSDTDPSNYIISRFTHPKQPFSLHNQETTYSTTLKAFFTVFQISPYFE